MLTNTENQLFLNIVIRDNISYMIVNFSFAQIIFRRYW